MDIAVKDPRRISHRLRWLAKLAFPEISTQRTMFGFAHDPIWTISITSWDGDPPTRREYIETLRLNGFAMVGRKTQRAGEIVCAYSKAADICVILDPNFITR